MKRSYKQNCALAHALDVVGERWTMLIVRELLIGPRRYGELMENLAGIGTNLLAGRLQELQDNGLVEKTDDGYQLTMLGRELAPAVWALIRFGLNLPQKSRADWLTRREWDVVALRAVYDEEAGAALSGLYAMVLDGVVFLVDKDAGEVRIRREDTDYADAVVVLSKETAMRLATGRDTFSTANANGRLEVHGNHGEAKQLLRSFGLVA